jgi:hypothetical protein
MSPYSLGRSQVYGSSATAMSPSHEVSWIRPQSQSYAPPPMRPSQARERAERANASVVIMLTLACTALSIFDLFLLAAGS